MKSKIPKDFVELFKLKVIGILSTIQDDNTPQSSIVWIDYEEPYILFNSITDRQKYKNIKKNPSVSLLIIDPNNMYHYIELRGKIDIITTENAINFIDRLAKKYLGVDSYPYHREGITRVIYKLKPSSVYHYKENPNIK